jgi:hypothetical protein
MYHVVCWRLVMKTAAVVFQIESSCKSCTYCYALGEVDRLVCDGAVI